MESYVKKQGIQPETATMNGISTSDVSIVAIVSNNAKALGYCQFGSACRRRLVSGPTPLGANRRLAEIIALPNCRFAKATAGYRLVALPE